MRQYVSSATMLAMPPEEARHPPRAARPDGAYETRAAALIRELRRRGFATANELEDLLGSTRSTIYRTIDLLKRASVVEPAPQGFRLAPGLGVVAGVDVTHSLARVAVADLAFNLLNEPENAVVPVTITEPGKTLDDIVQLLVSELQSAVGPRRVAQNFVGVTLVLPSPIGRRANPEPKRDASAWDRYIAAGPVLPEKWRRPDLDVPGGFANRLKDALRDLGVELPRHASRRVVWMENDASAGALGVHTMLRGLSDQDVAKDLTGLVSGRTKDLLFVRVTAGIGAGIVNKGHLLNGSEGFAGEIGHIIVDPGGAICPACGGRGCLETVASNRAVLAQLDATPSAVVASLEPMITASKEAAAIDDQLQRRLNEHPGAERALWDAGWHVGTAIAHACCLLNPSSIWLDGTMPKHTIAAERPFMKAVEHAIERNAMRQVSNVNPRTWDELWPDLEPPYDPQLLGALALVVDHLGDAYLLKPLARWLRTRRSGSVDFTLD